MKFREYLNVCGVTSSTGPLLPQSTDPLLAKDSGDVIRNAVDGRLTDLYRFRPFLMDGKAYITQISVEQCTLLSQNIHGID